MEFFRTPGLDGFAITGIKGIAGQTMIYAYG
jgi:hypothetical protein